MIKLSFCNQNKQVDILVDGIKYVKCKDNLTYWMFNRCINGVIAKKGVSEYRQENNIAIFIKINDEKISKFDDIYIVDSKFDIDEDFKLGAKSLSLKYLSSLIEKQLYSDEVHQLNLMLLITTSLLGNDLIKVTNLELNQKTLPKLLSLSCVQEEMCIDGLDIQYEDLILLQVKMINEFAIDSKRTIVFIDVVFLSEKLIKELGKYCDKLNLVVLYVTGINPTTNNIWVNGIDLENDNELYERMNKMTNYYDLNDYKNFLKAEYLSNNN